jgi:NAD(P)-dependent dehydrogenase (short-subunit alcohol dehydrogenase family)
MSGEVRSLDGRHAIITGAGSGIGEAAARRLAGLGAKITLVGRSPEKLRRVADTLPEAFVAPADVTQDDQLAEAVETARKRFGSVAILVNNAGVAPSAPFLKTTRLNLDSVMAVNLTGAFLASQAALPDMIALGWGRIVNVASTAALQGYGYVAAYCASKHALLGLTRALAREVARKGVTVNAVCPGFVETAIVDQAVATIVAKTGRTEEEARTELAASNPQGRLIRPDEVADAIAWLCLPQTEGVNGAAIPISGGEI